jgi:hypothetical protein
VSNFSKLEISLVYLIGLYAHAQSSARFFLNLLKASLLAYTFEGLKGLNTTSLMAVSEEETVVGVVSSYPVLGSKSCIGR